MSQITLITQGNKPTHWAKPLIEDYLRRTRAWWRIDWQHLAISKPKADPLLRLFQERRTQGRFIVALDERGKSWTSVDLSKQINDWLITHHQLDFIVGPPEGLPAMIKEQANQCWALSSLTLTHEMAAVLAAEQLYRCAALAHSHPYHKP